MLRPSSDGVFQLFSVLLTFPFNTHILINELQRFLIPKTKQNTAVYTRCINYFSNPYFSSDDQKDGHPGRNGYYRGSEYTSEQDPSVFVKPNQVNE